jgi:anaerobic selenocysteine-containing dehydrogenase
LPSHNNFHGSIIMGAYSELLPGGYARTKGAQLPLQWGVEPPADNSCWSAASLSGKDRVKALYLIGEIPFSSEPNADFLIFQNIYPPDGFCHADLVLPAAAFAEIDGSFINGEGRVQLVRKAVDAPGGALPDWQILCRIAQKMGVPGFDFSSTESIREEISQVAESLGRFTEITRDPIPLHAAGELFVTKPKSAVPSPRSEDYPYLLTISAVEHSHRGFPLSTWVEGSKMLLTEGVLEINPEDAKKAGIARGDEVVITSVHFEKVLPARLVREQSPGTLHASLREYTYFNPNPQPVRIRRQQCSG